MTSALSSLEEAFRNVGVSRAYGPAVRVDGEELIPVALVSFGFGGGSEADSAANAGTAKPGASGGGGGGFVLPLGVYSKGPNGRVAFRPNTITLLAGLAPLVCAVGFSLRAVIRTLRS